MTTESPAFRCACGCTRAERIHITRAARSIYRTEFVRCAECHAMFHFARDIEAEKGPPAFPVGYMEPLSMPGQSKLSANDLEAIKQAAARAQRSRSRRR